MQGGDDPYLDWGDFSVSRSARAQCEALSSNPEIIYRGTRLCVYLLHVN